MSPVSKTSVIKDSIRLAIHGKDDVIDAVVCALLAGGHVLLEDIPGVGKTTLVTALAKVLSLDYKRVQFTPDVLPSDLTGFNMYDKNTGNFSFHEGAIYTNLFLADEINRTSPKTQSALLEVMEEGQATVDGVTRSLPKPFFVIATQNPIGASGTQKLPDSQLDRFMIRLSMGYPNHESAIEILKGATGSSMKAPAATRVKSATSASRRKAPPMMSSAIYLRLSVRTSSLHSSRKHWTFTYPKDYMNMRFL